MRPQDVIFDSRFRNSGSLSKPTFTMTPPLENVVGVSLLWSNIPFTWYVIQENNNTFDFGITCLNEANSALASEVTYSFVIRPGTYSPESFAAEFYRLLNDKATADAAASIKQGLSTTVDGGVFAAKFEMFLMPESARFCIYVKDPNNAKRATFRIRFNGDLGPLVGFPSNVWTVATAADNGTTIVNGINVWKQGVRQQLNAAAVFGTSAVRLVGPSVMKLISNISNLVNPGSMARNQNDGEQVLARLPVTGNYTTYMIFNNSVEKVPVSGKQIVDNVTFSLKLDGRELYYDYKEYSEQTSPFYGNGNQQNAAFAVTDYLPLNGEGFQVCLRFYLDDDTTMSN